MGSFVVGVGGVESETLPFAVPFERVERREVTVGAGEEERTLKALTVEAGERGSSSSPVGCAGSSCSSPSRSRGLGVSSEVGSEEERGSSPSSDELESSSESSDVEDEVLARGEGSLGTKSKGGALRVRAVNSLMSRVEGGRRSAGGAETDEERVLTSGSGRMRGRV